MTAYWQIWAADSLAARSDNARLVYRQLQIKRGLIFAANGRTVLARNSAAGGDGFTIYTRVYPSQGFSRMPSGTTPSSRAAPASSSPTTTS